MKNEETWSVLATRNGKEIVCIGNDFVSGKSRFDADDEEAIRRAARHLLAFAGGCATEAPCKNSLPSQ